MKKNTPPALILRCGNRCHLYVFAISLYQWTGIFHRGTDERNSHKIKSHTTNAQNLQDTYKSKTETGSYKTQF